MENRNAKVWFGIIALIALTACVGGIIKSVSGNTAAQKPDRTKEQNFDLANGWTQLNGIIRVRGTASGHLTIAFDGGSHDSAQSTSKQSFTWHFVPAEDRSEYRNIAIDLSDGTLIYSSRQLTIASGRYELLRLSIETSSKKELADQIGQFERLPSSAIFERGKALARYVNDSEKALRLWHCGETDGLCAIRLSGEKGLNQFEDEGGPSCPAGGVGATSCSLPSCCSVSCGAGYYACCHCTENCRCIPNSGT